jgi:hypothetical protein
MDILLSTGEEVVGQFRQVKNDKLYLENANYLFIIQKDVIEQISENGEVLEFRMLSETINEPINFNRGFQIVNITIENLSSTYVKAQIGSNVLALGQDWFNYRAVGQELILKKHFVTLYPSLMFIGWFKVDLGRRWFDRSSELVISPSYFHFPLFFGLPIPYKFMRRASISSTYRKYSRQNFKGFYYGVGAGLSYGESSDGPDDWPAFARNTKKTFYYFPVLEVGRLIHRGDGLLMDFNLRVFPTYFLEKEYDQDWSTKPSHRTWALPNIGFGITF